MTESHMYRQQLSRIPFNRPHLVGKELEYIAQAIASAKLSGDGEFTRRCDRLIEERFHAARVRLTTSCTTALEIAALLCQKPEPGEVIVPGFTFVSTANAFVLHGYTPVFAEIRPDTCNLDETRLEEAITPRTRAIVPVHYAGVSCNMGAILEIARVHDIAVVEDAAQGIGSLYKGRYLGTLGDVGAYSFHDTKNYTSGEGGAVLINRPEYQERAELIREKGTNRAAFLRGQVDKYTWVDVGGSYLPSEILAAFLLAQLEGFDSIQAKRRKVFERYQVGLASLAQSERCRIPVIPDGCAINYHLFFLIVDGIETRTKLIRYLAEKDIVAAFHYVPLHLSPMGSQWGRGPGSLPVVEAVSDGLLRLPLFADLTIAEVDRVVEAVHEFFKRH